MTTLQCNGVDDTAAVQAAVNAGGVIYLEGPSCKLLSTLAMTTSRTAIMATCDIVSAANPAITMAGSNFTLESHGPMVNLFAPGLGIKFLSGGGIFLRKLRIETGGWGVHLVNGAGGYLDTVQFEGTPGAGSYPLRVGTWDTLRVRELIAEEHDSGIRVDNASNLQLADVILDRLGAQYGTALHLEAGAGQVIANVQTCNYWASMGRWTVVLNAAPGVISSVQMENSYFSGFATNPPAINGNVSGFQPGKVLYG